MDPSEYKLIKIEYTKEDHVRISEYNDQHTKMAFKLLKHNRDSLLNNKEYKDLSEEDRIKKIQQHVDYKEFCKAYPIVSKYIIAFGLFSKKAFVKYLDWKAKVRPSDESRAKLVSNQRGQEKFKNKYMYAIYVKYLYQEKNKHRNLADINNAYTLTVKSLNEETDQFFDLYEKEVKVQEVKKEQYTEEKKQNIIKQLKLKLEKGLA